MRERAVGPGGGIGQPSPNSANGTPNTRTAPLVHVEHMHTSDKADILRQSQQAQRGRAGGGVVLAGSN